METFNIFAKVQEELEDFSSTRISISGVEDQPKSLTRANNSNTFSQHETLDLIDLYYNSKFQTGPTDSEGQRKVFLNICQFRADVASKMIDLDTKDFIFIPENSQSVWPAYFLGKDFKIWAKKKKFAKLINDCVMDFPKYGTVVVKQVGDDVKRVPLKKLKNSQDVECLKDAEYIIEEHDLTYDEMKEMKGWDTEGLKYFDGRMKVYERYGMIPGDEGMVKGMVVISIDKAKKGEDPNGTIFFESETDEIPYVEAHWKKQDGRWLGIGEIENQFENQLSRNVLANLRRRALLWSSKKIFQSADDTIAKNLIKNVKDGDVLKIAPNGNITQVDNQTRSLAEFQSDEQVWERNSDQKSFTFEVATGESMPSGTPFRLGVVLSNSVKTHFDLKRENLGLFFKELIEDKMIKIFKKETDDHIINLFGDEEGIEELREATINGFVNQRIKKAILEEGILPDPVSIRAEVEKEITSRKHLFFEIKKEMYEDIEYKVDLVITGEQVDVATKLTTYQTILQLIGQNPQIVADPSMRKILGRIVALTGDNLDAMIGKATPQMGGQMGAPGMAQGGLNNVAPLAPAPQQL